MTNLAVKKQNDVVSITLSLSLNSQITHGQGRKDHIENGIKLGGPKWKTSNSKDQMKTTPNFKGQQCTLV